MPRLLEELLFCLHVGNHPFGSVRGRGGSEVGHFIEDGTVCFVPDGTDHWCGEGCHQAHEPLIAKGQEVHEISTTPGHDDDLHSGVIVKLLERGHDLAD